MREPGRTWVVPRAAPRHAATVRFALSINELDMSLQTECPPTEGHLHLLLMQSRRTHHGAGAGQGRQVQVLSRQLQGLPTSALQPPRATQNALNVHPLQLSMPDPHQAKEPFPRGSWRPPADVSGAQAREQWLVMLCWHGTADPAAADHWVPGVSGYKTKGPWAASGQQEDRHGQSGPQHGDHERHGSPGTGSQEIPARDPPRVVLELTLQAPLGVRAVAVPSGHLPARPALLSDCSGTCSTGPAGYAVPLPDQGQGPHKRLPLHPA